MTIILRTTARTVLPIVLTGSVAYFLQGHNLPGGGFIGGTLAATGIGLVYLAYGSDLLRSEILRIEESPPTDDQELRPELDARQQGVIRVYRGLFAGGLGIAVLGGFVPLLFGYPFLSQAVVLVHGLPIYGEIEFASALVFDLGVYVAVVGAVLTVIAEVGAE